MKTFAVVVNWNGGDENLDCLASLVAQDLAEERIVFVDNGSTDGSFERALERHPRLRTVRNDANKGFGEGANQGARVALDEGAEAVFFVNNDVVLPAGVLGALEERLDADEALGIVGPRVLYRHDPSRVWSAGGMLTWRQNLSTLLGHGRPDGLEWRATREVDYVAGCAMLVRRGVVDRIGLLDASYFAYMEDVDFCLRAREAGFKVLLAGELSCLHSTSSATGGGYNARRKYMMGVNSIWFLRRHGGPPQWLRFLVFDVGSLPFLWIAALFRGRSRAVLSKGLGIVDGLRGKRVTPERIREGAGLFW